MQQIKESHSEEQRADTIEEMRIRVNSFRNLELVHQCQIRKKNRSRMAAHSELQRVTVHRNYNLELKAFYYDFMEKYNEVT